MNRREFLQTSGALIVSAFPEIGFSQGKPNLVLGELDSWIAVMPDGGVKAFFAKMDMRQGLEVAVARYGESADQAPDIEALIALDAEVRAAYATGPIGSHA